MTTRESIAVILAAAAFAAAWRGMDLLRAAFTSPATSAAMWLLTGFGACALFAVLIVVANAAQDGARLAMHDRGAHVAPRTIDVPSRTLPSQGLDDARSTLARAQADLAAARAEAERLRNQRAPAQAPGRLVSNGFSGVDWRNTSAQWPTGREE